LRSLDASRGASNLALDQALLEVRLRLALLHVGWLAPECPPVMFLAGVELSKKGRREEKAATLPHRPATSRRPRVAPAKRLAYANTAYSGATLAKS
jgi:hypothetical protein